MGLKLLIICFIALSFFMALWFFANWFAWSMADFDCDEGYWACRRGVAGTIALNVGVPLAAWATLAGLLARIWKRG